MKEFGVCTGYKMRADIDKIYVLFKVQGSIDVVLELTRAEGQKLIKDLRSTIKRLP